MDANERRARAFADAAQWWLRLRTGEMPRNEREQFVGWLRESPLHVEEMLRIAQVHDSLDRFEHWGRISTEGAADEKIVEFAQFPIHPSPDAPAVPGGRAVPRTQNRGLFWRGALVASALAASMAVLLWGTGLLSHTIETERGERREVVLNDGSILEVDPQTRLRVKFEDRARSIILERGRALFRVARDPERPFIVRVDETVVRAVGTAFGVERTDGAVVVTVAEGKVAVSSIPLQRLKREGTHDGGMDEVYVIANQQVAVQRKHTASPVREVDSNRELAWTQGRLVFTEDTITKAVADFNRYNHVQLRVVDEALGARPVSGVFDASDPESFVAFIQTVAQVRIDRGNGRDIRIASAR